jgi:alpha-tubulin suppressor-like RCC1 family protein
MCDDVQPQLLSKRPLVICVRYAVMIAFGVALLAGCQPAASDCTVDSDCAAGQVCAKGGGIVFSGGVCVRDTAASPADASEDASPGDSGCVPTSCQEADVTCGEIPNSCGGSPIDCGECGSGTFCTAGQCTDDPCTARTCDDIAAGCGTFADGCGGTVTCGGATCIAAVDAGLAHTCVVRGDGQLLCWGDNSSGQFGDGSFDTSTSPTPTDTQASGLTPMAVAAGRDHSCLLDVNDAVWCWGLNTFGQLGTGDDAETLRNTTRPMLANSSQINGRVVELASYLNTTCARTDAAKVSCWGSGASGQMGRGDNAEENPLPSPPSGVSTALLSVAPAACYTCALSDDAVICWGDYDDGCQGDGLPNSAEEIHTGYDFSAGATLASGGGHTCFGDGSSSVYCFGDNQLGQLGTSSQTPFSVDEIEVDLGAQVTELAAGATYTCALLANGQVRCWGDNQHGKLGNGAQVDSHQPVEVELSGTARSIVAGVEHTCAVLDDDSVWCWGKNFDGQLGDGQSGPNTFSSTPVQVQF